MNQNLTEITVLLDRSGSMSLVQDATIKGFNEFVEGQKNVPGDANISLIQFDSAAPYERVFSKPVKEAPALTNETFRPRGSTPLHDAIGQTITSLGARLKSMKEEDRPGKVVVVIMTDGLENSSMIYTAAQVAEMIEHQRSVYKWQFIFLGANQDACMTGEKLNIPVAQSVTYAHTPAGMAGAMRGMTTNMASYRVTGQSASLNWTDEQRKEADPDAN